MPELPEVELTMRHLLDCGIVGKTVVNIYFYRHTEPKRRRYQTSAQSPLSSRLFDVLSNVSKMRQIREAVCGSAITSIKRIGKYLLLSVGKSTVMLHLGMSGKLFMHSTDKPIAQARSIRRAQQLSERTDIRILLCFTDGSCLTFCDARMFGSIAVYPNMQSITDALGVDALGGTLHPDLIASVHSRRCSIKSLLLSQRPIAGLGNIYCDEVLWLAKLHPEQRVCDLKPTDIATLLSAIPAVLNAAIVFGGTNLQDGVHGFESPYITSTNQLHIKVYGRHGQPCERCHTKIIKYWHHQRGTHLCPSCQKVSATH